MTPEGEQAIRALSWEEVNEVIGQFAPLNPYDPQKVPGSILELEEENFPRLRHEPKTRPQLWYLGVMSKRYALFNLKDGEVDIRKGSEQTLGSYMPPVEEDRTKPVVGWTDQAWDWIVKRALGGPANPQPGWWSQTARRVFRLSRPQMTQWFRGDPVSARPFEMLEHVLPANPFVSVPKPGRRSPCLVRPVRAISGLRGGWIDIHDPEGPTYREGPAHRGNADRAIFAPETYGDLMERHTYRPESKSQDWLGQPCGKFTVGLLERRRVVATGIRYIGKEANELDLIEAGLIPEDREFLTEYPRDIREYLPEILRLIPAKTLAKKLNICLRHAKYLRSGGRKPSPELLPKVIQLAAETARGILGEIGEPEIPRADEETVKLAAFRLRNSSDPHP